MKTWYYFLLALSLSFGWLDTASAAALPVAPISSTQQLEQPPVQPEQKLSRRQMRRATKKALRQPQQTQNERLVISVILGILIPCVGVYIWQQSLTIDFWITLILMFLLWLPGIIYALYVILLKG